MKFNNEILFFNKTNMKYIVFLVLLITIYLNDITAKETKNYPNSKYLLDFNYYHTTQVKIIFHFCKFFLKYLGNG